MIETFVSVSVASLGRYGVGYAVGFAVVQEDGKLLDEGQYSCDPSTCFGTLQAHDELKRQPAALTHGCETPREVRSVFWDKYERWLKRGIKIVAFGDRASVALFFGDAVRDAPEKRKWPKINYFEDYFKNEQPVLDQLGKAWGMLSAQQQARHGASLITAFVERFRATENQAERSSVSSAEIEQRGAYLELQKMLGVSSSTEMLETVKQLMKNSQRFAAIKEHAVSLSIVDSTWSLKTTTLGFMGSRLETLVDSIGAQRPR